MSQVTYMTPSCLPTSDCDPQSVQHTEFNIYCDVDLLGSDLLGVFVCLLEDCIETCASFNYHRTKCEGEGEHDLLGSVGRFGLSEGSDRSVRRPLSQRCQRHFFDAGGIPQCCVVISQLGSYTMSRKSRQEQPSVPSCILITTESIDG